MLPVRKHLQQRPWSCGPASLRIVLHSLGLHLGEEELIHMSDASRERGTQPAGLMRALDHLRIQYQEVEPGSLAAIERHLHAFEYVVVDYQAWGRRGHDYRALLTGHYSVVFGFNASHLFLADPAKKPRTGIDPWGTRSVRKDLFERRWRDRGPGGLRTHRWMLCVPLAQHRR